MNKVRWALGALLALSVTLVLASSAEAQASRTWVSGVGDDVNPCSRTAPCKTFAGAISKTAVAGEINCLDPAGFGSVTITKSMTIVCQFTEGGITNPNVSGVVINVTASDIVTLKGLDINGIATGVNGINFVGAGTLHVLDTHINGSRGSGNGITFAPNGVASLLVDDCEITDNGNSTTTGGILIRPAAGGSANVTINHSQINHNSVGIRADATNGAVLGTVRDTVVSGNTNNGITVVGPSLQAYLMVDHCLVTANNYGLVVNGALASLFVNNSTVTTNQVGVFQNGSGTLGTYKNNAVNGNVTTDGAFTVTLIGG